MIKKEMISGAVLLSPIILLVIIFGGIVPKKASALTATASSPYFYNFNTFGLVREVSSMGDSASPYWWVNSGAYLKIIDGHGSTNKGSLPPSDPWRTTYSLTNPIDTDLGAHPQNIFRLLTLSKWGSSRVESYFIVRENNLSSSSNRNASNGLLLMNRYQNGDNLYYAGVRVDGSAIIKKKKNGIYYTMAEVKNIYSGNYDRSQSPSLLPQDKWIGLRTEVKNLALGKVEIKLFIDKLWSGDWQLVASTIDDGSKYGGGAFTLTGYVGVRTDFMDVEFENFRIRNI